GGGGRAENQALLDQRFDYIFFTGGAEVGRQVMEKAAKHLTPVTLELGGKSPCVVDATARLDLAAKRIAFGKLLNCGQTCVAPDYLLVDRRVKEELISRVGYWMERMYGRDPLDNDGYVHMVNRKHFDRVCALIDPAKVVYGGGADPDALRIQPTILDGVSPDDPVMGEEIFGPLLPVLEFEDIRQAEDFILDRPRPLALYLFSEDKAVQRRFVRHIPFGGGCVNDTIMHLANPRLPFGGVGNSGMGSYHGRQSFETFSHTKSLVQSSTRLDLPVRYAPYTEAQDKLIRRFLK
ncbi:aldehyde dehydrogenase family protein, partial [Pseudoflavonifractor phocaeensis]|uniref:aldehyde dehydrogenase family protein n=1 Tax=Pseudoflavonifractor phocaeensis TaxID=1870988 RepID=UPI001F2C07BB